MLLLPFLWHCAPLIQNTSTNNHKGFRPFPIGVSKAALTTTPTPTPHKHRRIALLIGINKYNDKTWHPLRFAAKDARDLAKVLQQKHLGYFDKLMLHVEPQKTTKAAILAAFKKLQTLNLHSEDTVLVYVSGHGTLARDAQHRLKRFLVTTDSKAQQVAQTAVSISLLRRLFGRLKSQRKVMLLATCHSGNGKSRLNGRMRTELRSVKGPFFIKPFETVSKATIFLGVCGFGETAQESSKLRNDIYTHYFIKALKNRYDLNGDGAITVLEAHDYAKELTYHHTHGQQRAYAESDILGTDPIILIGKKTRPGKPVLYAYSNRFFGVEVRVNGTSKGTFPRGVKVTAGKQKITLIASNGKNVLFDGEVHFQPGERIQADKIFQRQFYNFSIATKGGYQFFLSGSSEQRMSRPLPLIGFDLRWKRFANINIPLDLRFEFAFAHNSHVLEEQDNRPQTVTEANLGIALTYALEWKMFALFAGLRLSGIYLNRQSDLHKNINDFFFSFQPGILAGLEWTFLPQWSFFAESRLNYTYITTADGKPLHQGSFELMGGLNFHF